MLPTDIVDIKRRAEAVNLTLKKLARRCTIDPSTLYRAARGQGDNLSRTIRPLGEQIVAEERRLLAHLIAIHGVPDREAAP